MPQEAGWQLSPTQQGMWLDEKRAPQGSAYSLPFLLTLDGNLDPAALIQACLHVIARHPVLSCAIHEGAGGIPCLAPAPLAPLVMTADLRGAPECGLDAMLGAAVETEISKSFDLSSGPLLRLTLFLLEPRRSALLVVAHHLVFDRLSMDIFVRDMAAFYRSAVCGHEPELPAVQPGAQIHSAEDERWVAATLPLAREYWSAHWRESTTVSLPYASRVASGMMEGSHATESTEFRLARRENTLLRLAADAIGVTKFEYLLAALSALLYRYGNKSPSVSIALGQRTSVSANMIGPFVQEVPFTVPLGGDMRFGDFARHLRSGLRELYEFRRFPLGLAIPGASPAAVQSVISISYAQHNPVLEAPELRITWRFLFNFHSRSPFSISVLDEYEKKMRVMLRHSPAFIDAPGIANIARHWRRLSYAGAVRPTSRIDELPLLDRNERNKVTRRFNVTAARYPADTFLDLFRAQAARTPRQIAAISGNTSITYAELDAGSGRLAHRLLQAHLEVGSVAVIFMRPSARRLLTVLAVLKTGAAYLPLEVETPYARVSAILSDAKPSAVLVDGPEEAGLFGTDARVLRADSLSAEGSNEESTTPGPRHERDLAYLIYTSGSTGRPKGVAVEHAALANLINAFRKITRTGTNATWLAHTSLAFDMAVLEICLPLATGGTVVIAQDREMKNGSELLRLIREHRVTHLQATPSGWELLLNAGFHEPGVAAIVGGETLSLPLGRRLRPRVRHLLNTYGPTEATVWASYTEISRDTECITIGRPIANTRAYILGDRGEVVPAGCAGELFLAGLGLARGYFRCPAQTAERFVADAFGAPAGRMYRTGDRARYRADGTIEFLGRLDDQVKVRGHRIELGEVEARLAAYPSVGRCAVVARGEEGLNRHLIAFVSPAGGQAPLRSELDKWMAEVLPAYMLPAAYVVLDQFPLTATGKLDRASLPDLPAPGAGGPAPAAAEDSLEQSVRQVCQEILRVRDVGSTENLFGLGANSLTIMQISRRISLQVGVDVPLEMLFEAPTVAGIARLISEAGQSHQKPADVITRLWSPG